MTAAWPTGRSGLFSFAYTLVLSIFRHVSRVFGRDILQLVVFHYPWEIMGWAMGSGWLSVVCLSAFGLTGCAIKANFEEPQKLRVPALIDHIQCEVRDATSKHGELLEGNWAVSATLFLQIDETGSLSPSVNLIEPLSSPATSFIFGGSATVGQAKQRIYNQSFDLDLSKLKGKDCRPDKIGQDKLAGDLGIVEVTDIAFGSFGVDDPAMTLSKAPTGAFGTTLQFALNRSAAAGPTWTLTNFNGPGRLISGSRTDMHKIVVAFANGSSPADAKAKATQNMNLLLFETGNNRTQAIPGSFFNR